MEEETKKSVTRVIQNTWWKDSQNRTWLIHSVWFNQGNPTNIYLLQFGKSELVEQPYELIQSYVDKNIFIPITT